MTTTMRPRPIFLSLQTVIGLALLAAGSPLPGQTSAPGVRPLSAADQEQVNQLLQQVDLAIDVNSRRFLEANRHSPWQIFHGILALRHDFQVKLGDRKISAIEWIAASEPKFDNEPLIVVTEYGANFHSFTRPYAFQGHPGQFLALLTESNLPTDFKFKAQGRDVTIADILRDTMMTVNAHEEVTWVLWGLNHYLKSDARWTNKFGEPWSIERLVQTENYAVVERAACGGNHGLFALSRARDKYLKTGQPLRGVWLEADQKVKRYAETARALQNGDGSFSSKFYAGPEFSRDINTRLNSTGHTLEFLAASLPDERLREPWVRNAVAALSKDLYEHRHMPVDCGPLYHSLNALIIYRERIRGGVPPQIVLKPTSNGSPTPAPAAPLKIAKEGLPSASADAPVSALEPANR
jgi:hypothetical protein